MKKWVWERFTASQCYDCRHPVWILIQTPTNFILGNTYNSVQGVRVCDWSSGWRVLSVWKLLRSQGREWESPGLGLNILMQSKHGFCRGMGLGYLVRPGDTRTCCRSDRCTQGSRDLSTGERSNREIEAGLGLGYQGFGTEVAEMVMLWVHFEWWAAREQRAKGGRKHPLQSSSFWSSSDTDKNS